jgi:hypothetical protein
VPVRWWSLTQLGKSGHLAYFHILQKATSVLPTPD